MMRESCQPLHARILHRHLGIKPLGDGMADEGGTFLLKQLDQPLLLGDQGVDLRRLSVEEGDDQRCSSAVECLVRSCWMYASDRSGQPHRSWTCQPRR